MICDSRRPFRPAPAVALPSAKGQTASAVAAADGENNRPDASSGARRASHRTREEAMRPFSYTNARGDTYYLHAVRLGGGRPGYVMRKRRDGAMPVLPEGYEVRENVYGQVSVRRRRPRLFTEAEEQLLADQLKRLRPFAYRLDIEGRTATIYASAMDRKCFAESLDAEFEHGFADALTKTLAGKYSAELVALFRARRKEKGARRPRFYPLLRFVIQDEARRLFAVERVCFTGDSAWLRLDILPLAAAMMKYLPHLGRDSFFDLI